MKSARRSCQKVGRVEGFSGGHRRSLGSQEAWPAQHRVPRGFSHGVCPPAFCHSGNIFLFQNLSGAAKPFEKECTPNSEADSEFLRNADGFVYSVKFFWYPRAACVSIQCRRSCLLK